MGDEAHFYLNGYVNTQNSDSGELKILEMFTKEPHIQIGLLPGVGLQQRGLLAHIFLKTVKAMLKP